MSSQRKRKVRTPPSGSVPRLPVRPDDTVEAANARVLLTPSLLAGLTIGGFTGGVPELEPGQLSVALEQQADAVGKGDLRRLADILTIQAHTLDVIFNQLARRAAENMAAHLGACETYLRLALKAQSQCGSTLEGLAEIKNPRPLFVGQANFARGPQQVNNVEAIPAAARARESEIPPSKLLEAKDGERLDTRAPGTAGAANQELATVGALDRTEDGKG